MSQLKAVLEQRLGVENSYRILQSASLILWLLPFCRQASAHIVILNRILCLTQFVKAEGINND